MHRSRAAALVLFSLLGVGTARAQDPTAADVPADVPAPAPTDVTPPPAPAPAPAPVEEPLPDYLANKARLSPEASRDKTDGGYFTGLPLVNSDPDTGVGFGARVYYYYNGHRDNPRFDRTPYLHRVYAQGFASTNGLQYHTIDYDGPYIHGGPHRIRANINYQKNTNANYFGVGRASLAPLRFPGDAREFSSVSDYADAARAVQPNGTTYARYNNYILEAPQLTASIERDLFGGIVRPLLGINVSHVNVRAYSGDVVNALDVRGNTVTAPSADSKLREDCHAGIVLGCDGGWNNFVKVGLALDTRDFEPDPNKGFFVDLVGEFSSRALGSRFDYGRVTLTPRVYFSPFPKLADVVLAARGLYSIQFGDVPFYAMNNIASSDGDNQGIGGLRTLRGYKQDRFVGKVAALVNLEIRWTMFGFDLSRQHFDLGIVPFLDMGRIFDDVSGTTLKGWKRGQGAGLRIAWNHSTIIVVDYGFSTEGSGLYINFNHTF